MFYLSFGASHAVDSESRQIKSLINGREGEMKTRNAFLIVMIVTAALLTPRNNTSAGIETHENWKTLTVEATAYCPCQKCCGIYSDNITAIGRDALLKGIAVDKSIIPLRSLVDIPGYGTVMADDVGGAIKKNRIDVRFNTHQEALEWGRQKITIRYLPPEAQ